MLVKPFHPARIWPLVFLWAISKPRPLNVAITSGGLGGLDTATQERIAELEARLRKLEEPKMAATPTTGKAAV